MTQTTQPKMTEMATYLTALISEKGRSVEAALPVEGHINLSYQNLIEFIDQMPAPVQKQIRDTLVMIDFKNGDVFHYLDFLVQGMIKAQGLDAFV